MEHHKDKIIVSSILAFISLFLLIDTYADFKTGVPLYHSITQTFVILISAVGIYWIWKNHLSFQSLLNQKKNKIQHLTIKNKELSAGIGTAIDRQFNLWDLTSTEKEIGFLLLKGCSLKDIALYRNTAQITVRQQSAKIYEKSKLSGRAELSAFFIEDFLIHNEQLNHS
jgi:DNA-binding CsgD family transcriptional regulator